MRCVGGEVHGLSKQINNTPDELICCVTKPVKVVMHTYDAIQDTTVVIILMHLMLMRRKMQS